jgi:glyoxylase-like metal-dependent hydrolase (beta-lactamase superfamily II)
MRIHHLNCATLRPLGGYLMDGMTPGIGPVNLVCHTLLIESSDGLILVDTGLGISDVLKPQERINPIFRKLFRPRLDFKETAYHQIELMGLNPMDVKHIILTHLDLDHAGGIDDFPNARVHVMNVERQAALKNKSILSRTRYSPKQLTRARFWNTYYPGKDRWYGFQCVRNLEGLPPEILLISLLGHSHGHAGVAIETDRGWLLHAGSAYYYRGELDKEYHCPPGLMAIQKMMEVNRDLRLMNQDRLRHLANYYAHEVTVFSSHDPIEYLSLRESGEIYVLSESMKHNYTVDDLSSMGLS